MLPVRVRVCVCVSSRPAGFATMSACTSRLACSHQGLELTRLPLIAASNRAYYAFLQSMNTVMDDNKMLTLASNERIPLTSSMRLLLEINHMNHCSPATVSRGGVIFVNGGCCKMFSGLDYMTFFSNGRRQSTELSCTDQQKQFALIVPLPQLRTLAGSQLWTRGSASWSVLTTSRC